MPDQSFFDRGDRQDAIFFALLRDRFPEMSDEEFRAQVMAPISFRVFRSTISAVVSNLPPELKQAVVEVLFPGASVESIERF